MKPCSSKTKSGGFGVSFTTTVTVSVFFSSTTTFCAPWASARLANPRAARLKSALILTCILRLNRAGTALFREGGGHSASVCELFACEWGHRKLRRVMTPDGCKELDLEQFFTQIRESAPGRVAPPAQALKGAALAPRNASSGAGPVHLSAPRAGWYDPRSHLSPTEVTCFLRFDPSPPPPIALLSLPTLSAAETVKIGAAFSLTGNAAAYGAQQKAGVQAAIDDVNKSGKLKGITLELVLEDDGTSKEQGIAVFQRFINRDKVSAIIGPTLSTTATAADPIAQQGEDPGGRGVQHRARRASPTSATTSGASRSPRPR